MYDSIRALDLISSVVTLLEAPETKSRDAFMLCGARLETDYTMSTTFRHSGWRHDRRLVVESMSRTGQTVDRIKQFSVCGSHSYVVQSSLDPSHYKVVGSACHDRFCLPCSHERSQNIAHNVIEQIELKCVRFLTLTLKSSDEPLSFLLNKLYKSFAIMRRRTFWRKHVKGGVAFLEVKWNEQAHRWHPHFHCLITGSYVAQNKLSKLWHEATGNSYIIDIRLVRSHTLAARYITKYASKPFNNTFVNRPARLDEALTTLKGRRLILTFDSWRGVLVSKESSDEVWEYVDSLDAVITSAAHGDAESQFILGRITDRDLSDIYTMAPARASPEFVEPASHIQLEFSHVWTSEGEFERFVRGNR